MYHVHHAARCHTWSQAAIATVVLFLGYLYLKANPVAPADAAGRAGRPVRRRAPREPGVLGALRYFFGPLPEGPAFAPGGAQDEAAPGATGPPVEAIGAKRAPATQTKPPPAPAPAVETAADRARSAAAREAAARRAEARAAAAAQQPE